MDIPIAQDMNHNIIKLLQNREQNQDTARCLRQQTQFTDNLIKRLSLEHELEGHQGCVNCIEWTADGRYLASGSDDTNVILWDPFCHRKLKTINTPHIGNIFSVKFLGSNNSMIASAAGDCRVVVQNVEQESPSVPLLDCSCHRGRVKRLATAPDQPLVFWSASEDGLVIQYDIREAHTCATNCSIFVDLAPTKELKCIAVNPTKPHYVAIGANDSYVRLFDRRLVKTKPFRWNLSQDIMYPIIDESCVQYYTPGHLSNNDVSQYKVAVTYIAFNSRGSELLVNMGGEQIYLFDVDNPRFTNEIRMPDFTGKTPVHRKINGCSSYLPELGLKPPLPSDPSTSTNGNNRLSAYYLNRANLLLQRKWIGDSYSAARDYLHVIYLWPQITEAYLGLIDCFILLKWKSEAIAWLTYFLKNHPDYALKQIIETKRKDIHRIAKDLLIDHFETTTDNELNLIEKSIDFDARYLGHCNTTTDIKEANFVGENGQYVLAGSDDGIIFIWDRHTTNIVTALWGDVSIVNCVQPHPNACLIATSGIDPVVKLWSPSNEDGTENLRQVKYLEAAVEANQRRMSMDPFETMLANMGYRLRESENEMSTCRTS